MGDIYNLYLQFYGAATNTLWFVYEVTENKQQRNGMLSYQIC